MVRVIPLGGLGEFGLNAMVLEHGDERLLIDAGLMFPSPLTPGIGVVVPDWTWLLEEPEKLKGVVLTHGHEDHVGALPSLLERLQVPVYGTPFTLGVARGRVDVAGLAGDFRSVDAREEFLVGTGFRVELIRVMHSIPEATAISVRTPDGTSLVHTGDLKLDDDPVDGLGTDLRRFEELGEEGVTCLLSDSTGAEQERPTPPEREVERTFAELFPRAKGRLIVSMFASNVHRLKFTLELAATLGRKVVLAGRSLQRNIDLARELGLIDVPSHLIVPAEDAPSLPAHQVLILATGSQAEPRSALVQMAMGTWLARSTPPPIPAADVEPGAPGHAHAGDPEALIPLPTLTIQAGDTVILSARAIPGNERLVGALIDRLLERGATVYYGGSYPGVHVSGHGSQPHQRRIIEAVRPRHFVPIHGELRHLHRHLQLARETGLVPEPGLLLARDGDVLEFQNGTGRHVAQIPTGRVLKDRWGDGQLDDAAVAEREKLAELGIIVAALVVDVAGQRIVSGPHLEGRGLSREEALFLPDVAVDARQTLETVTRALLGDVAFVREELTRAVRRAMKQRTGKRSAVLPIVVRL
ncbi:MAG: ribonuclease J [Myxococcaceae bacterium]|nr:ribonuclease J [Myxococcaceae bacterium]